MIVRVCSSCFSSHESTGSGKIESSTNEKSFAGCESQPGRRMSKLTINALRRFEQIARFILGGNAHRGLFLSTTFKRWHRWGGGERRNVKGHLPLTGSATTTLGWGSHHGIIPTRGGSAVRCTVLCVPSMGENQKGFKSPVYRMNIEKMKRTTRSQLREGDRPWGGRLWESHQATNRLTRREAHVS